jgi:hypothetical protein
MKKLHHASFPANVSRVICCKLVLSEPEHREVYYDKYIAGLNFKCETVGLKNLIKAVYGC